jgi:hypothetical protein
MSRQSRIGREQRILCLLEAMADPFASPSDRYDKFCRLFFTELRFNHVHIELDLKPWAGVSATLAETPVLLAASSGEQESRVIYSCLASDRLSPDQERAVVTPLLGEYGQALFVFSTRERDVWHLLSVEDAAKPSPVFRRLIVGPDERLSMAAERLAIVADQPANGSALEPRLLWERVFDVERLQGEFLRAFARAYGRIAQDLFRACGSRAQAGRLAQLLLDRLIFLYFVQRRGWLDLDPKYLHLRLLRCWMRAPEQATYYTDVLQPFFLRLSDSGVRCEKIGTVLFLSAGMFKSPDILNASIEQPYSQIPNTTFKAIFDELLERFSFTTAEGTAGDVELAIGPEMLGTIFESFVLRTNQPASQRPLRKSTGSYYTPGRIVDFMCREALKEHLAAQLVRRHQLDSKSATAKIGRLVALPPAEECNPQQLGMLEQTVSAEEASTLRKSMLECKVCDPAVGSGAFLIGMLHEMVALIARLDVRLHGRQALARRNYRYDLKNQIIRSCLHGVDLQPEAIQLCKLRLWLSLLSDYHMEPGRPLPIALDDVPRLPGLRDRVVQGDSLLESRGWPGDCVASFAWRVNFAEVFSRKGGFDIIIGNPPYLSARRFQHNKKQLAEKYVTASGSYDIYVLFMELGMTLLNPEGVQCLITSNKFLIADYARPLRTFLREHTRIKLLVDLADCAGVFKALVSPAITLLIPGSMAASDTVRLAALRGSDFARIEHNMFRDETIASLQKNGSGRFDIYIRSSSRELIDRIEKDSIPLGQLGALRTGIMGFDYWSMEPHVTDGTQPCGRPLQRVVTNSHLDRFRFLWGKPIRLYGQPYKNPCISKDCELINGSTREFFNAKKVIMRGVAKTTTAAWDVRGSGLLVAVHGFAPQKSIDGYFITGLLNSDVFDWLHKITFYSGRIPRGSLRYPVAFWKSLPVRLGPQPLIEEISRVSREISLKSHVPDDELSRQLNKRVSELYELAGSDLHRNSFPC